MKIIINRLIWILIVLVVFVGGIEALAQNEGKKSPIKIVSDKMVYNQNKGTVVFEGNVVAKQDELVLRSNTLEVFFRKDKLKQKQKLAKLTITQNKQLDKIIASGDVVINKADKTAKCGLAIYDLKSKKIILKDNPVLQQNKNEIRGETIIFYVDKDLVEIEGNKSKRVEAIFVQEGKR